MPMIFIGGLGGMGLPSNNEEKIPVITDEQVREKMMEYLRDNPGIVENLEKDDFTQRFYERNLKNSIHVPENWESTNFQRPTKDKADEIKEDLIKNGIKLPSTSRVGSGTDMRIWTYQNKVWEEYERGFRIDAIMEFGEILAFQVDVNLEEDFFF